jgi:hypothetical protein
MIPQHDLAAYWQHPLRHGFAKPSFDVRVNELHPRTGKFVSSHMVYVRSWTHESAKPAALAWLRELMTGKRMGVLRVVEVEYSQPVTWGIQPKERAA